MIYNFKTTEDNQQWVIDTEALAWSKASSIVAAPSVKAVESNLARFVESEGGRLIPLGGGRYGFEGRKPFDEAGKPQLCIVILVTILSAEDGGTCVVFLQANVDTKDAQHQEIKKFKMECLPAIRPVKAHKPIVMPPITADEQKAAAGVPVEPVKQETASTEA